MSFKKNLLFGLGLSLLLLFISSLASYISINNLINNSQMVRNSNKIIKDLDNLLSLVKDAETGQRGYLLTGNQAFLAPYTKAKENISHSIAALQPAIPQRTFKMTISKNLRSTLKRVCRSWTKTSIIKKEIMLYLPNSC